MSEKDSDPTLQGHSAGPPGGLDQKSAFAQPINRTERGASNPAECDITQSSQIAHVQIPLDPGALSLACEFDHNGQCADSGAKKYKLDVHANRRIQIGERSK
jgi:hypothetical protein